MSGTKQETKKERKTREDAEANARQSPFGFFILGQSYLESANTLVSALEVQALNFAPQFKHPIRHLYAHGWELCLKACLFEQGWKPSDLKKAYGHSLIKAWQSVERDKFASLQLTDDLERLLKVFDEYHGPKLYSYPDSDWQITPSYRYVTEATARLLIPNSEVGKLFRGSRAFPKHSK